MIRVGRQSEGVLFLAARFSIYLVPGEGQLMGHAAALADRLWCLLTGSRSPVREGAMCGDAALSVIVSCLGYGSSLLAMSASSQPPLQQ